MLRSSALSARLAARSAQAVLDGAPERVAGSLPGLIVDSMNDGVIAADVEGRFLLFNATARKLFPIEETGESLATWRQSHEVLTLDGRVLDVPQDRPLDRAIRGESLDSWELVFRRPGAGDRVLRIGTRPLPDAEGQLVGGVMVFNDITESKAAQEFALAQEQVLALIARGAPLQQSLEAVVRLMEKNLPDSLCSILLLQGAQLRLGAAPSLPDSFNQAIERLPIGEGVGACGTAAFRNAPVMVEDVALDPCMQGCRELLRTHGLRACWAMPVVSSQGDVLATLAIYHRHPCKPEARDLELIGAAARLAGIALERVRVEAAFVGSEARFRELAENIEDVFYNVDPHTGRLLYISPGYEKVWGRSRESLYANPLSYADAVVPEDLPVLTQVRKHNRRGEASDVEYRILSPDGKMRWVRDHSYPVFNAAGELERVVGIAHDITDRKLADLALASTHRALQMLSSSSIAINRMEDEASLLAEVCRVAVGVGSYRMAWVGYAQSDETHSIVPQAHAGAEGGYLASIQLSWGDDRANGRGPAGRAIRSGLPAQCQDISRAEADFYWREAALQRGYCSAICLPLRDGARSFGVLCLYSGEVQHFATNEIKLLQELADTLAFGILSLRTRLERQRARDEILRLNASLEERVRQRTEQLEFANKQLESFSYSVSHDLRTPLSAIDGFSDLLERSLAKAASDPLTERSRHYLARIRAGVTQMGELINALLMLARVSRTSLRWEPVDLSALARTLLASYQEREPGREALLEVQPGLLVQGDPRLLQQVLDNLLGNAWKFSSKQPQTHISFGRESGPDGGAVYVVRDSGAGFDMAYAERLFGAFQRLHTVSEFPGTGIGLATVHRIVSRHGGRVWAESVPGQGAGFYFTLGDAPAEEFV